MNSINASFSSDPNATSFYLGLNNRIANMIGSGGCVVTKPATFPSTTSPATLPNSSANGMQEIVTVLTQMLQSVFEVLSKLISSITGNPSENIATVNSAGTAGAASASTATAQAAGTEAAKQAVESNGGFGDTLKSLFDIGSTVLSFFSPITGGIMKGASAIFSKATNVFKKFF